MKDNLQNSKVGLTHQLEEIGKLIEKKDYLTALAQIREIQSSGRIDSFPVDTPSEKAGLFYYLSARVFRHLGSYQEALESVQKATSIFIELHDELGIAQTQYLTGLICINTGNLKLAEMEVRDALTGFRRIKYLKGVIDCLSQLSHIEFIKGNHSKSIEYLKDALAYGDKAMETNKRAFLCGNLGMMFLMIGNWNEAESNLLLNTGLNRQAKDELNLCRGLLSLGYVYFLKREFKKAKDTYEESLSLIQKNNCVRELTIFHEYSGELSFVQGNYQSAENHYKKVFEIMSERAPEGDMISQTYRLLADLQVAKKEYDHAFSSCQKALRVSKSLGERVEESACYRILGQIYTFRGDKEKAQGNFHQSLSIFQEIQAKYELAKTYLEAGKSNCYDYYERMKYLSMAEDKFKELESEYHLGLVKLAHSYLFFDKQEYISAGLYLKDAEKIYKELGEEKELALVAEFRNKLSRFSGEVEVSSFEKIYTFSNIITRNKKMLDILEEAKRIKDIDMTILIEGETGTGKDLLAKCIHCESKRKDKKFVVAQCSAVPETLLENALFGHIKGAYTGADESSVGLFEEAAGGTLYIDEIAEIPLSTQVKLLRAIEDKEITRIGETKPKKIDVRIIVSTSRNLMERVSKEFFRKDLYFRLNTFNLKLLPLRERKEDIPLLIEYFLKKNGTAEDNLKLSEYPELIEKLQRYDWPGNIRELKNEIDKLMISTTNGEKIDPPYLLKITTSFKKVEIKKENATLYDEMDEIEKEKIKEVLEQTNYVKVKAAELLGIPVSSLKSKIKKYNILTPD
jgi:DNA-binding NtrC family response regulator/uncharacterized protein HemY